jgi:protein TonB
LIAGAAVVALHVGAGVWLYHQKFVIPVETPPTSQPITTYLLPPPPPPKPQVEPDAPRKSPPPIRQALETPFMKTIEPLPVAPSQTVTEQPAGPLVDLTAPPVSDPPAPLVPPAPPVIRNPTWEKLPSADQLARHYPRRALEQELTGRAVIACRVTVRGTVEGCAVSSETPAGAGFGEAAMKLARYFKMSPRTVDGRSVEGGSVSIPIAFRLD